VATGCAVAATQPASQPPRGDVYYWSSVLYMTINSVFINQAPKFFEKDIFQKGVAYQGNLKQQNPATHR
jgi:hypothetical protein